MYHSLLVLSSRIYIYTLRLVIAFYLYIIVLFPYHSCNIYDYVVVGYIAVELAGVLKGLGSDVTMFLRGDKALRNFDSMLSNQLDSSMKANGMLSLALMLLLCDVDVAIVYGY